MTEDYETDEFTEMYQNAKKSFSRMMETTKGKIAAGVGAVALGLAVYEGMTDLDSSERYELDINRDGKADTEIVKKDGYAPGNGYFFGEKVELYMENGEGEMERIGTDSTPYTGEFYTEPGEGRIVAEISRNSLEEDRYIKVELEDLKEKEHGEKETEYTDTSRELEEDFEELPYDKVTLTNIE